MKRANTQQVAESFEVKKNKDEPSSASSSSTALDVLRVTKPQADTPLQSNPAADVFLEENLAKKILSFLPENASVNFMKKVRTISRPLYHAVEVHYKRAAERQHLDYKNSVFKSIACFYIHIEGLHRATAKEVYKIRKVIENTGNQFNLTPWFEALFSQPGIHGDLLMQAYLALNKDNEVDAICNGFFEADDFYGDDNAYEWTYSISLASMLARLLFSKSPKCRRVAKEAWDYLLTNDLFNFSDLVIEKGRPLIQLWSSLLNTHCWRDSPVMRSSKINIYEEMLQLIQTPSFFTTFHREENIYWDGLEGTSFHIYPQLYEKDATRYYGENYVKHSIFELPLAALIHYIFGLSEEQTRFDVKSNVIFDIALTGFELVKKEKIGDSTDFQQQLDFINQLCGNLPALVKLMVACGFRPESNVISIPEEIIDKFPSFLIANIIDALKANNYEISVVNGLSPTYKKD